MKKFTPEEFWQDLVKAVTKSLKSPEDLVLDTSVVRSLAVELEGARIRIDFEDEDGPDRVVVNRSDIQEGNYMRQGEDGGTLAWSFETPQGSFTLRTQPKRLSMPTLDGSKLDGIAGSYTNGDAGPYRGSAGKVVTVDYHNMLLYEADESAVDAPPSAVFHVSDGKSLAQILNG